MTQKTLSIAAAALLAFSVTACTQSEPTETDTVAIDQSAEINAWFEDEFERQIARSPQYQTFLGRKTNYGAWDDVSAEYEAESHRLSLAALAEMRARFDPEKLDPVAAQSYRLFEYQVESADERFALRDRWYVFSQFRGPHSTAPTFLANQHRVSSLDDAEAYISRLDGFAAYMAMHQKNAEDQFAKGVHLPRWSYPQMIETAKNIIKGAPFDDSEEPSAMLADFVRKVESLDLDPSAESDLKTRAETALKNSVQPAYEALIEMFERHLSEAGEGDGAWKLPDGAAYYAGQLKWRTTTDMSATQIHDLGLIEVARIHDEMNAIREQVGFEGDLNSFFEYMRNDPDERFSYPNTDEGRAQYLAEATAYIDNMRDRLPEIFATFPKAELEIRRVEAFRERAAGKAFYQRPAPDGSRPGIYYANLYNMANMPIYQMEALAYHEALPGHHMQIAIAQELENMPSFRKYGSITAYSEGWGLYSEYLPKEMGLYADPYSDFGRLAMELWRAARLVVDTGIHEKQWTREEAIDYLIKNTPNPAGDCEKAIERYTVMPGQATAYKVGMLKILELREHAKEALGDDFDIRAFHDVILKGGPLPLAVLEETVEAWIAETKDA